MRFLETMDGIAKIITEIGEFIKATDDRVILYICVFFGVRYLLKELDKRDKAIIQTVRANTKAFRYFTRAILKSDLSKDVSQNDIDILEDDFFDKEH